VTTRAIELTQAREPAPPRARVLWRWALTGLAIAGLFVVYWRQSWTAAANSDSAATALQAWDMLHGNWLLHGWWMSDVSFYTTELPQYLLLELVGGFGVWVVHVAAAMSYTLIVVLVALLAWGRGTRGSGGPARSEGLARAVLAGGIAASPQVSGAMILLLGPDHTGTVVPVLATWLVIDRVRPDARHARWFMPVLVGLLLTWIMVADSVVLFTGIAPLIVAAVVRAVRRSGSGSASRRRYELSLAAAAVVAAGLGLLSPKLMAHLGGYQVWRFQTHTMPLAQLPRDAWHTIEAVLELFGANVFEPHPVLETVLVTVHFAGVLLAVAGLVAAIARFFREESILVPALAVAIVLELGAFLVSIHSQNLASIREIVAVMPFGAVLAGRLLAGPLLGLLARPAPHRDDGSAPRPARRVWRSPRVWLAPLAGVVVAGYLGAMVYGAAQASVPAANQDLATWLTEHHLTGGLAAYWQAGSLTLDSGGRVAVNGVIVDRQGRVGRYLWESATTAYDPSRHTATFVVAGGPVVDVPLPGLAKAAVRTFGHPTHIYHFGAYEILVWPRNILRDLPQS
jgi:hypothetical protein